MSQVHAEGSLDFLQPDVASLATEVAEELAAEGAEAVALVGSHARGAPRARSDVDIVAIWDRSEVHFRQRGERLLVLTLEPIEALRARLHHPAEAGVAVRIWRSAVLLYDPDHAARQLQQQAWDFRWGQIDAACDAYVADAMGGYAEEVGKLVGALQEPRDGELLNAAAQRSILAVRLARVMAVHYRLTYESENVLWDRVGEEIGEPWASLQAAALANHGESPIESARAALGLFALAAHSTRRLLDEGQRAVVDAAARLAETALEG